MERLRPEHCGLVVRPATAARVPRQHLEGGRLARQRASARASVGSAHLSRLPYPFVDGAQRLIRGVPPEGPRRGRGYKSTLETEGARSHTRKILPADLADLCRKLCWVAYNAGVDPNSRVIK